MPLTLPFLIKLLYVLILLSLPARSRIGLAMSQDGRNWARIEADHHTGALFDAGEEGDWDACLNGAPQVKRDTIDLLTQLFRV